MQTTHQTTLEWLENVHLNPECAVLATMALALAKSFDENAHTSTAAELRKTILEIKRIAEGSQIVVDPIAELLTRNAVSQ